MITENGNGLVKRLPECPEMWLLWNCAKGVRNWPFLPENKHHPRTAKPMYYSKKWEFKQELGVRRAGSAKKLCPSGGGVLYTLDGTKIH